MHLTTRHSLMEQTAKRMFKFGRSGFCHSITVLSTKSSTVAWMLSWRVSSKVGYWILTVQFAVKILDKFSNLSMLKEM